MLEAEQLHPPRQTFAKNISLLLLSAHEVPGTFSST